MSAVTVLGAGGASASAPAGDSVCGDVNQFLGDAGHLGTLWGPGPTGTPSVLWSVPTASPMNSSVAVADGVVYVAAGIMGQGGLWAIDAADGAVLWSVELPGQPFSSTPAVVDGIAIVGDLDGNVTAIDVASRATAWTVSLAESISSSPAVADGTVYVNAEDVVYALDPATGETRWSFENGGDGGYTVESSPAVVDGVVYTTSISSDADDSLWALDAATGEELWSYGPDVPGLTSPVVRNDVVYAGGDGGLVAVDALTGDELWASPVGRIMSSPAATDEIVVAQTTGDMVAVDPATGAELWRSRTGGGWATPMAEDDVVYAGSNGVAAFHSIHLVDAATGEQLALVPGFGSVNAPVVITGGVMFAPTSDGVVALGTPGVNACAAPSNP